MKNFKVFSLFASLFLIFGMATTGCSQTNPDSAISNDSSISNSNDDTSTSSHEHTFSRSYEYDDTYHWHPSTCGHNVVSEKEKHTFKEEVTDPTYENGGYTTYTCSICGYSYVDNETSKLEHNYSSTWSYDEYSHWHACIDKGYEHLKKDESSHTFTTSITDPTYEQGGYTTYTCSICGYSYVDNKTNALPITITWKNYDGSILEVDNNVPYGSMPTFDGEIPTREDDNQYTYTFDGWSPQITKAVEPRAYIAQFASVKKQFTFVSYGEGYALTNYSGTDTVVTIPDEYNGRPVVAIGTYGTGFSSGRPDGFYYNGSIEKVVLPSSLRTINQYAFSNCIALTEVDDSKIEDRFDIMAYSFFNTPSLQEFIIRGSVYNNAFYSSGIKKLTIDRNITSFIGTGTAYICNSCNNLNEIVFTGNNYIFQSNMYIAYNCNNLTKVTFTDANCELEGPVLNGMYNLKEVTLPTLTCPIWELFGKTEYNKSFQLELLSEKVELPDVSNCEITEKEEHRFDMGYTIVYLYSPKSWAINDFWFYDGDCWWFLASNNYQFYYSMYEYTLNDLWVMIEWPHSVYSDDFIRMPKDLKIISLDSNLKADSEYLLNTGYEVVYQ